jgi:RimJ/RimL family protein N-acetyltransferase
MSATKRPVGARVDPLPSGIIADGRPLSGRYVRIEKAAAAAHAPALFESFSKADPEGQVWTYLGYGPFASYGDFHAWLVEREQSRDPLFHTFIPRRSGKASGMGSFMRMDGANGVIEIGHIWMAPGLQRTREASEAIFLMMRHAFDDLGMRRLEWKCDALNAPSRRAADRFGFIFEGVFRQHMIVKGRNRDTAWYAIIDKDWPPIRKAFEDWLKPDNFDSDGRQKRRLAGLRRVAGKRSR